MRRSVHLEAWDIKVADESGEIKGEASGRVKRALLASFETWITKAGW